MNVRFRVTLTTDERGSTPSATGFAAWYWLARAHFAD